MKLVTDYLEDTAERFPHKVALIDSQRKVCFVEMQAESKRIASKLISIGLEKQPVVVYMDKSVEVIEAFLGVAYSRNFYSPIDIRMPESRVRKILETLQPRAVITKRECLLTPDLFEDIPILFFDELMKESADDAAVAAVTKRTIDTDILYVLFTSGSTGIPKGVIICHRSVIDYTEWVTKIFGIDETHVFGNQAPFYFDNSVLDIFQMLKTGATLNIIPENLFSFPIKLLEYISENKVNTIFWVPSALCLVANLKALGKRDISCIKKILFAGEVMPTRQLNMWRRVLPGALYANLYGPTEITVDCTCYIVDREFDDSESLPIGFPCENSDVLILNDQNQLVTGDEIGELCVRGSSLSLGYYNNLQKTREVFVQNPLNDKYEEIIYRTGDLVKYNERGELLYCSRKDFQIKHMGHRIELGEIETAVSSLGEIQSCCCLYDEQRQKIVLFYKGNLDGKEIMGMISDLVPEYMIPNRFEKLDEMPINLNGKIDRVALKGML